MKRLLIPILLLLGLAFAASHATAADMQMEFIALKHRPAEEMIPLLQPFLRPDASITGTQYKLFIRTTPDNFAELREMIDSLDSPPKPLLVTVTHDIDLVMRERGMGVSGYIGNTGSRVRGSITSTTSRSQIGDTQQVQVLEGQPASIQMGESVPVYGSTVTRGPYGAVVQETMQYQDITRGFAVLARVQGDQVTVEINPHRDTLSARGGDRIDTQSIHTTLRGRLGEWLEIGGVAETRQHSGSGIVYSTGSRETDQRRIFLKVEPLP